MTDNNREMPFSLRRKLMKERPEKGHQQHKKPGVLTNGIIWEAPQGYRSVGIVVVENFQLVKDTVPERIHRMNESNGEIIIKLQSETIVKDGQLVIDRITAEYYEREFLCC